MSIGFPSITSLTCFLAVSVSRDRRSLASGFDSVLLVLSSVLSTTVSPETFNVNFRMSSVILSWVMRSVWSGDAVFTSVGEEEKLSEPAARSIDPSPTERLLPLHFAVAWWPFVVAYALPVPLANHLSLGWCAPSPSQSKMRGPIFHRSPMQPSRILIRPTSTSYTRDTSSSSSWFGDFPDIWTASSLDSALPWNGTPTVVTGPESEALTIPIGVLNELETSPRSTQPMVRPPRLIGIPRVSCFTASLVPSIVGPLPSGTMNGFAPHFRARPSL